MIIKKAEGLIDPKTGKSLTEPVDFDIGFAKSDLMIFGSYNAIEEKLGYIKQRYGDDIYQQVIANIVLIKKILTEGKAYKRVGYGVLGVLK